MSLTNRFRFTTAPCSQQPKRPPQRCKKGGQVARSSLDSGRRLSCGRCSRGARRGASSRGGARRCSRGDVGSVTHTERNKKTPEKRLFACGLAYCQVSNSSCISEPRGAFIGVLHLYFFFLSSCKSRRLPRYTRSERTSTMRTHMELTNTEFAAACHQCNYCTLLQNFGLISTRKAPRRGEHERDPGSCSCSGEQ